MELELNFSFEGTSTIIQCNSKDKLSDIFTRFANKAEVSQKSLIFLCYGNTLNGEQKIEEKLNQEDLKRKKMNILVYKQENEVEERQTIQYFKPLHLICTKCNENARINLTQYKILSKCKNDHFIGNILLHENKAKQKIDMSKIICEVCQRQNKASTFNKIFFRCLNCKINFCPLCKNKHDNTHKVINYEEKDYLCDLHNEKLSSFCESCQKNICMYCIEHDKHKLVTFKEIFPDINVETEKIGELEDLVNKVKNKLDFMIDRIKIVKENFEYYYEIIKNNLILLNEKKINYEILYNYNKIKNREIEEDMNYVIKTRDINENFRKVNDIYFKMTNKFQEIITINYKIENTPIIKLFGSEFVKNNKNICSMIINQEEMKLKDQINLKDINREKGILEVKLNGVQNITNISYMFSGCSALYSLPDIENWNTINVTNMSNLFYKCSLNENNFKGIKEWNTENVNYMDYMFSECSDTTTLPDISRWNTKNLKSMNHMFSGCLKLKEIPKISNWDTQNVEEMDSVFADCSTLSNLPEIIEWNTTKVKRMTKMFSGCKKLEALPDISKWNTSEKTSIEDISGMFSGCSSLTSLPDISNWNTAKVFNMSSIFQNCISLAFLPNISKWNTNIVMFMNNMFDGCTSLKTIPDISCWNTIKVKNISYMFSNCKSLISLPDISKFKFEIINDMRNLFAGCSSLKSLPDISKWITKESGTNLLYLNGVFSGCSSLKSLPDISNWNIPNVLYMHKLFENCCSLKSLPDISKWDVSNIKTINYLFSGCSSLKFLPDISKWNLKNVQEMNYLFNNCSNLVKLPDISLWDFSKVKKVIGLFKDCSSLTELPDLSKWQMDNVENMKEMFYGCSSLTSLPDISRWNTQNVKNMNSIFQNCSSLNKLPKLSNWNINNVKEGFFMFKGCHKKLKLPKFKKIKMK